MKKTVYFIPVILGLLFYGMISVRGIKSISPIVIVWLVVFAIAGILLSKGICWGGVPGLVAAFYFIYNINTQETGQVVNGTFLGVILLIYYAVCIYFVRKNNLKSR